MPKPRTEAREQRRIARDLARRHAISSVEMLIEPTNAVYNGPVTVAYQAEVRRIVERMRFQYRLRAEPTPRPEAATGDRARVAGSEPGESGA